MEQNLITIIVPVAQMKRQKLEDRLDALDNPASKDMRIALWKSARIHFISGALVHGEEATDYLVLEMSVDSQDHECLAFFDQTETGLSQLFDPLFDVLELPGSKSSILKQHILKVGVGYFNVPGLSFSGAPGMDVQRIKDDYRLARGIREYFDQEGLSGTSLEIVAKLRNAIKSDHIFTKEDEHKPALKTLLSDQEAVILQGEKRKATDLRVIAQIAIVTVFKLMWPMLILAVLATYITLPAFESWVSFLIGGVWRFLAWSVGLLLLALGIFVIVLLRREVKEGSDLSLPDPSVLNEVRQREDSSYSQNHLFGVSEMKPGILRKISIRLTFLIIGELAKRSFRPGFLSEIGTIHFARWFMIPGTNKLIFCSNYGGSWESYLEDFITKATEGLTGVWSNTLGFPRARLLFFKGASSGEAFKRWARRQQIPTRFWYCAYPHLTTERIRKNAAIRIGLSKVKTETEADDFISLFASMVRSDSDIQRDEIQSLMFKGLGKHGVSANVFLKLPDTPRQAKSWLRAHLDQIGFGDVIPPARIDQIAFSATGLKKLSLDQETVAQFPYPFQQGMSHKDRSDALADTGDDAPSTWEWGSKTKSEDLTVDCAYLVYLPTDSGSVEQDYKTIKKYCAEIEDRLRASGGELVKRVVTTHFQARKANETQAGQRPVGNVDWPREPFGFVDGVSQPIIKGLHRGNKRSETPLHHVEPGEFILGYPDNRGTQTLFPVLPAASDPQNILPDYDARNIDMGLGKADQSLEALPRAFAKNGSYLVVRQLDQNVEKFEKYIDSAAKLHKAHKGIPAFFNHQQRKAFLAAKMVGRWQDGTSLVKFPYEPGTGWDGQKTNQPPDNDFLLGAEDAAGLACPYGSHVRRSNPRDSFVPHDEEQLEIVNRHRILRRGRFYKDPNTNAHGLMFMCFNADIERQFEFIQQTWCQAWQFMGLDNEVDPILGRGKTMGRVTIPTEQGPIFLKETPDSVTMKGGEYFFMPSKSALKYLASETG